MKKCADICAFMRNPEFIKLKMEYDSLVKIYEKMKDEYFTYEEKKQKAIGEKIRRNAYQLERFFLTKDNNKHFHKRLLGAGPCEIDFDKLMFDIKNIKDIGNNIINLNFEEAFSDSSQNVICDNLTINRLSISCSTLVDSK